MNMYFNICMGNSLKKSFLSFGNEKGCKFHKIYGVWNTKEKKQNHFLRFLG